MKELEKAADVQDLSGFIQQRALHAGATFYLPKL